MPPSIRRVRGTPCSYCAVPVLHPNQQCCLNCKNHPFDIMETDDNRLSSPDAHTPPISPTGSSYRAVGANGIPLNFEIRNIYDGSVVQIGADELKPEALWKYWGAELVYDREPSLDCQKEQRYESNSIIADHAIGIKIGGSAFGKTCLYAGDRFIVDRDDEDMAGSVIIYEDNLARSEMRIEYSIAEDSLNHTRVMIKTGTTAWYDQENGNPSPWLFHEGTLEKEAHEDGEGKLRIEDEHLHSVRFNIDTEGRYLGPDNLYDDRVLVDCEGTQFSIKRENIVIEVEVDENAYAQKLRENYSDLEQFWFQFDDKVRMIRPDEEDVSRVIISYEDGEFSVAKEDLDL